MKCKFRLLILPTLIALALTSCQSVQSIKSPNLIAEDHSAASATDKKFIAAFTKDLNLTHLVFRCRVFDLNGTEVAYYRGQLCWFDENGHYITSYRGGTIELNPKSSVVWKIEPTHFHHTLQKSIFRDEFLTLNSEYLSSKDYWLLRFDELIIFNRTGKITKKFKMSDYLKKHPLTGPPNVDTWSYNFEWKSWEYTHGNSFHETWRLKDGKKQHTGYVFFSNQEKVIYFLDSKLKKVTRSIKTNGRHLHDVQQYDENHLLAYGNATPSDFGGLYLINLKTGSIDLFYKFNNPIQASTACSSVQILPEKKFLLVHSKCYEEDAKETYVEFLDLKSGQNAFLKIMAPFSQQAGYLANLTSFIENNYSQ